MVMMTVSDNPLRPRRPTHRWLPKHGRPQCVWEAAVQATVKALAHLPVYAAVIIAVIILIQVFGQLWE